MAVRCTDDDDVHIYIQTLLFICSHICHASSDTSQRTTQIDVLYGGCCCCSTGTVDGWSEEEEGSEHNYHRRRMTPKCILFALQLLLLLLSGWDMIALFLPFNPNTIYLGAVTSRLSGELLVVVVVQSKFRK